MKYRTEIDGLRALAVIPVIFFHAGIGFFSGGFVGVDIFFVISGYLITFLLLNELSQKKFSLLKFYERRARRILPALGFVVLACMPFAWLWLTPRDLKDFAQSIAALSLFSSNILFWRESGYFDIAAEFKPLLHTWSLAVEEQYYILFPLFLAVMWPLGRRWIVGTLVFIFITSLALAEWYVKHDPSAAFFLLPMRGWEILVGAFTAFYLQKKHSAFSFKTQQALSIVGLFLLGYALFAFDKNTPFPSFYTLTPTLGTALIIIFANRGTIVHRLLSLKPIVGVGLISYSAYLWHQPLIAFAKHRLLPMPSETIMIGLCLAAFPLAYLSWRFVEQPFRNKETFNQKTIFSFSFVILAFFLFIGLAGHINQGYPKRLLNKGSSETVNIMLEDPNGLSPLCDVDVYTEAKECATSPTPDLLLWGDSYAMHLAQAFLGSQTNLSFRQHTFTSCAPLKNLSIIGKGKTENWARTCIEQNNKVWEWLLKNDSVKYVVLSSAFNFEKYDLLIKDKKVSYDFDLVFHHLKETISQIRSLGKHVVIISPTPQTGQDLGRCYTKMIMFNYPKNICDFAPENYGEMTKVAFNLLSKIEAEVPVIWLDQLICKNSTCSIIQDGIPLYRDEGHLSKIGSTLLGKKYNLGELTKKAF